MPRAIAVVPQVHGVEMPLGDRVNTVYLVGTPEDVLLFDVGVDGSAEDIRGALRDLGIPDDAVSQVLVSHCDVDHFGGLGSVRSAFRGARLAAHELDAPLIGDYERYEAERARGFRGYGMDEDPDVLAWARGVTGPAPLDGTVSGGEQIQLRGGPLVEVLHLPGHSPGHLGLWVEESRTVIVSDAVLGAAVPSADGSPVFPPTYRHVDKYRESARRLQAMGAGTLATAHYGVFSGDEVDAFLQASLDFADRLEAAVLDRLQKGGPQTLEELSASLTVTSGDWPDEGTAGAMAFPVAGHLELLESSGRLRRAPGSPVRWGLV